MTIPYLRTTVALAIGSVVLLVATALSAGEKLKVFILAGQSNIVGHARAHTIATLYKMGKPKDAELAKLVFRNDGVSKAFDEQIARAVAPGAVTQHPLA